jgi:hypothetical protein
MEEKIYKGEKENPLSSERKKETPNKRYITN